MPKVVFSNSFCYGWNIGAGTDYLSYMERPAAFVAKDKGTNPDYDMYDYMANSEKSDGLFTADKDCLTAAEVENYRSFEIQSRSEGCPKYVQVVSFDNSFLEENHIMVNGTVDKDKLRTAFRKAMAALIETEPKFDPSNCYWTAAIHTNTDNVHIHSALIEYHRKEDRCKTCRDKDLISVDAMNKLKSVMMNYLNETNDVTKEHTRIERELLLPSLKKAFTNPTLQMIELRRTLPSEGGWQYNRPKMKRFRPQIDEVVNSIINSNDEIKGLFQNYMSSLDGLTEYYKDMYGEGQQAQYVNYKVNTLNDFYARAGNSLLKALAELSDDDIKKVVTESAADDTNSADNDIVDDTDIDYADYSIISDKVKLHWNDQYKEGIKQLNAEEYKSAYDIFLKEAEQNNALAYMKLGLIYRRHLLGSQPDDAEKADTYDKMFFNSLLHFRDTENKLNKSYINYLLGKMYLQGQGCEVDNKKAFECFSAAEDNPYGANMLGNCYRYGIGTEIAPDKAVSAYRVSTDMSNPFAAYALAQCYDNGFGIEQDTEKASEYYQAAREGFIQLDGKMPSANLRYKIGMMYLQGNGCEPDKAEAVNWLTKSADGNDKNAMYQLGKIFLIDENYEKAENYLLKAVNSGNADAEYTLGRFYLEHFPADQKKTSIGISLLERQAINGNEYALHILGTRYLSEKKLKDKGVDYLHRAADTYGFEPSFLALGSYYLRTGRYSYAEKYLNRSAEKDNSYAYYQLGRLYSIRGNPAQAMRYYRKSAELGNKSASKYISRRTMSDSRFRQAAAIARHQHTIRTMRHATNILLSLYREQERHLRELQQQFEEENDIISDSYDDYGIGY
ncbi:MAG: SEL1-like repeat protein [Eubacterium sp.]|nr:SEL1-like repeat protein [Eubacterium sp.]